MKTTSFIVSRVARLLTVAGLGASTLAACAADPSSTDEATASASEALINDGRGPSNGFTCSGTSCTCSKEIVGDCDNMRKNCTGGLDKLDDCLKGWATTDCSCSYGARTTPRPPLQRAPIGASSGVVVSP